MQRRELLHSYYKFISRYQFDWFAVLMFRRWPSKRTAERRLHAWLADLRRRNGKRSFRWVRVLEMGKSGLNLHFHLLIGGLRSQDFRPYAEAWTRFGGVPIIRPYYAMPFSAEKNGLRYMLKTLTVRDGIDIEWHLPERKEKKSE